MPSQAFETGYGILTGPFLETGGAETNTALSAGARGVYAISLSASTVDTVSCSDDVDTVEVWADGSAAVYFTVDGTFPFVAAANTWELHPTSTSAGVSRAVPVNVGGPTVIQLISTGTPKY